MNATFGGRWKVSEAEPAYCSNWQLAVKFPKVERELKIHFQSKPTLYRRREGHNRSWHANSRLHLMWTPLACDMTWTSSFCLSPWLIRSTPTCWSSSLAFWCMMESIKNPIYWLLHWSQAGKTSQGEFREESTFQICWNPFILFVSQLMMHPSQAERGRSLHLPTFLYILSTFLKQGINHCDDSSLTF